MPKTDKAEQVAELKSMLREVSAFVLTDYRGLKVQDLQELRRRLRQRGVEYHVVKNTLLVRAAAESGLPDLKPLLAGPTAVALTPGDEVDLAKGIVDETRTIRSLKISGGVARGRLLSAADIQALAALPGRAQLQGTLVGTLEAPLGQLTATLLAPLRDLVATFAARAAAP